MAGRRITQTLRRQFFDGELTDADVAELNDVLLASDAALQEYVDLVHLREGMRRWARSRGSADVSRIIKLATEWETLSEPSEAVGNLLAGEGWASGEVGRSGRRRRNSGVAYRRFGSSWRGAGAMAVATAAALVAISVLLYAPRTLDDSAALDDLWSGDPTLSEEDSALSESDTVVARLTTATADVRWTRGRAPSDFLMRFRPGDVLGIDSGIAQVEFSGGAHLVVSSPAALQFTGGSSARLIQGSVTGRAENSSFALVTPSATVVDIGTEFGVGVGPGGTDVTVFEGELHVHSLLSGGEGGDMRRMREGMSMRIGADGKPVARMEGEPYVYRRDLLHPSNPRGASGVISLLDVVGGHDYSHARIAGSIDPRSGYWGKPPWLGPDRRKALRGDTQFTATPWNRMVDGVFIPRSNAREMQIDSDGHVVFLPPNSGSSWGPIWARRRSPIDIDGEFAAANRRDHWGERTLEAVQHRLLASRDGLLGLHANVGITFDLGSVRESAACELVEFNALLANLGASVEQDEAGEPSLADLRVFVDGKLRYSRLEFSVHDGEAEVAVPLGSDDHYLTIVATDSDGDPRLDHVVLIDPILRAEAPTPLAVRLPFRGLCAVDRRFDPMLPSM